jgi:predicted RNase H-like HicB family nuclease
MTAIDRYLILIEGGPPSNFSAWSPDVPGCVATGTMIESCVDEMRSALRSHIELAQEHSDPIPQSSGPGIYIEQTAAAA